MIKEIMATFLIAISISGCAALKTSEADVDKQIMCDEDADNALLSGELDKGIRLHENYLKANPNSSTACYHLGYAFGLIGAKEAEIYYYEKAVALGYKGSGDLYFNLGMAYAESELYDKAEVALKKSISIQPARSNSRLSLARIYIEFLNQPKKAEEQILAVLTLEPSNQEALEMMKYIPSP